MSSSSATLRMATPRRYLAQLCRHFAHRLPVTLAYARGSIAFPSGTCVLTAGEDTLSLEIEAGDDAARERTQEVLARHLLRFAFREPPVIVWRAAPAA